MLVTSIFFIVFLASSMGKRQEEVFCLERSRLIRLDRDGEAVIVEAFSGDSILLKCSYCDEVKNLEPRIWLYWNLTKGEAKELESHDRIKTTQSNSLVIQNISIEDVGFYFCRIPYEDSIQSSFNFLVDVQDHQEDDQWKGDLTNWVNYSMNYLVPVNTEINKLELSNIKFEVFSGWSSWSECETCKDNPIQTRIGHCRIKPTPNLVVSTLSAEPKIPEVILKTLIQTGAAFPCRGHLISYFDSEISSLVQNMPDFVQEKFCEPICPKRGVRDRKQLVLEEGGRAVVPCRGSIGGSKPRWEHNRRRINSATADGTAAVDRFGVLHLVGVAQGTKGNYTCFSSENNRLFELRVVITSSNSWGLGDEFKRHAFYLALVTGISFWSFTIITCGIYFMKKIRIQSHVDRNYDSDAQRPLLEDFTESE